MPGIDNTKRLCAVSTCGRQRWLVIVCLAFVSGCGQTAQSADLETESRDVSGFHAISASVAGEISLIRGDRESLSISALPETLEQIVTEVVDGQLTISRRGSASWWRDSGPIRIAITYTRLDAMSLSGSADVVTDKLTGPGFTLQISGSSDVKIPAMDVDTLEVGVQGSGNLLVAGMKAEVVDITVSGSGDVSLEGSVDEQTVVVRGSGNVDNAGLEARRVIAKISGSGDVTVWATEALQARISGSGDIEYRGDPEVDSKVTGSGEISRD